MRLFLTCLALCLALPAFARTLDDDIGHRFQGDGFDWLTDDAMLEPFLRDMFSAGDPEALAVLADLFRTGDPRAARALQNYLGRHPNDPGAFDIAGTDLMRQGDFASAVQAFAQTVKLAPSATWSRAKLGVSQILAGDVPRGLATLEEVIEADPDNPLARRYLSWGALQAGDLGRAILHAERALNAFGLPQDQINRAHLDLAELYLRTGQNDRLMTLLGAAVRNDDLKAPPANAFHAYGLYFEAAQRERDADAAREVFDRILSMSDHDTPQIGVSRGRLLMLEGKHAEAAELFSQLRDQYPELSQSLIPDLALAEAAMGEIDRAVERLSALAEVRGRAGDLPLYREITGMLLAEGRAQDAIARLEDRASAMPDRPELRHLLAETMLRAERGEDALAMARALTQENPGNAQLHYTAAIAASAVGDKDGARESLKRVLEIAPDDARAWLTLLGLNHGHDTYSHDHGGDASHDAVRDLLDRAIDAAPDSPDLRYELGLLTLSEGRPAEAVSAFDAALDIAPSHLPSMTLGALARIDAETDMAGAKRLLDVARALSSDDPVLDDIEGWRQVVSGNLDGGTDLLVQALDAAPEDATIRYHLAVARERAGEAQAARALYLEALGGDLYQHYTDDARAGLMRIDPSDSLEIAVNRIDATGVHETTGQLTLAMVDGNLSVTGEVGGLTPGEGSVHVHVKPVCGPAEGPGGPVAGGLSGAHYGHDEMDHAAMGHGSAAMATDADAVDHAAMGHGDMAMGGDMAMKPRGDLPNVMADADGVAQVSITTAALTLDELRGRSIMFHDGPDADGKSGAKIGCAVIH